MFFGNISPERRLINLAEHLSQQEGKILDLCKLMGVNPDHDFPAAGKSAFNSNGSPLQLNLSSSKKGTRVRVLADPQTAPVTWQKRRQNAYNRLNKILDAGSDPELAKACHDIADICLPKEAGINTTKDTKAGIAFGSEIGTPGLAIYGHGPWSTNAESWDNLLQKASEILPQPTTIVEFITKIRSISNLHGIGLAGTNSRNARIKLYWKLTEPTRIDLLGLPLESHQPFIKFLNTLYSESGFSLSTLFFCVGFDWQTGQFRDFKIDACCCENCLAHSQSKMIHFLEEIAHDFDIQTVDLRSIIYNQEARFSLLGMGYDYKGEIRLNSYLSPSTPIPNPMNVDGEREDNRNEPHRIAALRQAVDRAISYLYESQISSGAFLSSQSGERSLEPEITQETSAFVTSNILYGLGFSSNEKATAMCHKARKFLLAEMKPPGLWNYWSALYRTDLPSDLDDSSCAALALNKNVPTEYYKLDPQLFLNNRDEDGLFQTWVGSYQGKNDVDSVVNANVVSALGDSQEIQPVCDYLIETLKQKKESSSYWYYLNNTALYYAISRAIFLGISRLYPARQILIDRVSKVITNNIKTMTPLEAALNLCTLINLENDQEELIGRLSSHLIQSQNPRGNWEKTAYYGGQTPPGPKTIFFGSEELVTGFCIEALSRVSNYRHVS